MYVQRALRAARSASSAHRNRSFGSSLPAPPRLQSRAWMRMPAPMTASSPPTARLYSPMRATESFSTRFLPSACSPSDDPVRPSTTPVRVRGHARAGRQLRREGVGRTNIVPAHTLSRTLPAPSSRLPSAQSTRRDHWAQQQPRSRGAASTVSQLPSFAQPSFGGKSGLPGIVPTNATSRDNPLLTSPLQAAAHPLRSAVARRHLAFVH